MARSLRIQYPGAIYHVMNRGDRREDIYHDDQDRLCFLDTLGQACEKTGWQVHAFCLMGNHFHLLIETPQPNLSAGMKWLLQTYSSRFNRRHKFFSHVFSGRYKAPLVDGSGTGCLRTAAEYVHLNPVRAKLLKDEEPLRNQPMARSQPLWPGAAGNRRGPCAPNQRRDLAPGAVAPEKQGFLNSLRSHSSEPQC